MVNPQGETVVINCGWGETLELQFQRDDHDRTALRVMMVGPRGGIRSSVRIDDPAEVQALADAAASVVWLFPKT